jgi:hypothetical protein
MTKVLQVLILILGLAVFAAAQNVSGRSGRTTLTGTVYDVYGARIVKSKISAVNQKGEKFEALTDDEGVYTLNLPYNEYKPSSVGFKIAKYDITVEAGLPGFEKYILKDFKVVGQYISKMYLDFALDIVPTIIID